MNIEIDRLQKEIERLNVELQIIKIKEKEKEKTINSLIREKTAFKEKLQNDVLHEKELHTQIITWEKIIDEMAHSINSDVYVAVSYLSRLKKNATTEIALSHTKQIRDLINLIMFYLKRNEIKISGETVSISIEEVVEEQINTIKSSLSTLRLSTEEHEENLFRLEIPVKTIGNSNIKISVELKDAIRLIIKDLLRNAFKNTDEENPKISVEIIGEEKNVKLAIFNNRIIKDEFADWFNGKTEIEPNISKSVKVGLRVIKKWVKELGIKAELNPDKEKDGTTAIIIFPKGINYERKD